jgi:hypothetical protein
MAIAVQKITLSALHDVARTERLLELLRRFHYKNRDGFSFLASPDLWAAGMAAASNRCGNGPRLN